MIWQCSICGHHNDDADTTCLLCGGPKPVTVAPEKVPVCSLTATRAKAECNYADVTVPSKYNVIGEDAFKGRTDLYTIRIHSGVTKILRGAFDGCTNLYAVYVEGKLTSIGARAFAGCKYLSPEKRPTADTVASDAFAGCSNISLGIPTRTVASSSAARKASGTPSGTSRPSTARPTAPSGTSSFTKSTGTRPSTSTGTRPTTSTGPSSFTKTTPPPRPTPPPPPPPPPPPRSTSYTASTSKYPTYGDSIVSDGYTAGVVSFIIAAILTFVCFLFTDWGLLATGEAWQTAISLGLVAFVGMLAHYWFTEGDTKPVCILISVFTAVAALNWLFGGGLTVFGGILSAGLTMIAVMFTYIAFDGDDDLGWWLLGLVALNLVNIIAGAVVYNYNITGQTWQVIVALAIVLFMATGVQVSADDEDYSIATALSVFGIIVGGCIIWWFGGMFVHFASALTLGVAALSVVSAVKAFMSDESGFGTGLVITSLLNLAVFVVANVVIA
ncbi:MAG: leucine-rich repeat protein [Clostridia bacterium]|nr:leucine-rich repeat protein [Clostridia bacterium]